MPFSVFHSSRIGGREINQDRAAHAGANDALLVVVADGMGGHTRGEVAAQLATRILCERFRRAAPVEDAREFFQQSFLKVHDKIAEYAKEFDLPDHPRTTCVACLVRKGTACWAHVGDSRLYLVRARRIAQLTRDHSKVQWLLEKGLIAREEMATHPERNILYNCVGGTRAPEVEVSEKLRLKPGDTLLACTDGVWGALAAEEIGQIVLAFPLNDAVAKLTELAEFRGGKRADNATALGVRVEEDK